MKTKLKFLARSVILLVMLLAGSVTQGAWGATLLNGAKIYFDAGESNWGKDGATFKVNWYIGEAWQSATVMERIGDTNIWFAQSPKDGINKVEFLRMDENGQYQWNYTQKVEADPDNNCYYAASFTDNANTVGSKFYGTKTYTIWYQELETGDWKSASMSDNTVTIHLPAGESYFNLNNGVTAWGNTGIMTRTGCTSWQMNSNVLDGGQSCRINADIAGNYVFTLSPANKVISITYPSNDWYIVDGGTICGDATWTKLTSSAKFTEGDGGLYYFHYTGSGQDYFRVTDGSTQYLFGTSGSRTLSTDHKTLTPCENTTDISNLISGEGWICIDNNTKEIWYSSVDPSIYTITYNLNEGTNPASAVTTYDGTSAITLPVPTRSGYEFNGWFENASFSGSPVTTIPVGSRGNKTYWAKWTAKTAGKDWYVVDGGTISSSNTWSAYTSSAKFIEGENGLYYYHYEGTATNMYFRIADGSKQYLTGSGAVLNAYGTKFVMSETSNRDNSYQIPSAGWICIDNNTKEIWYTSEDPTLPTASRTIYFTNSNNYETPYCYAYKNGGSDADKNANWPGQKMTKVDGTDNLWKVDVLGHFDMFIFDDGNGQQTADSGTSSEDTNWYHDGKWSNYPGEITLNIYWYYPNKAKSFNSWLYNESKSGTHYADGYHAEWYYGTDTEGKAEECYFKDGIEVSKETDGAKLWYKKTLKFTGVNSTSETAKLGVGCQTTPGTYVPMEDIYFTKYISGEYNVYYYNCKIVKEPKDPEAVIEYYLIVKNEGKTETKKFKMSDSRYRVIGIDDAHKDDAGNMTEQNYTVMVKSENLFTGVNNCYISTKSDGSDVFAAPNGSWVVPFSDDLYSKTDYKRSYYNETTTSGTSYFQINNSGYQSYVFLIDVLKDETVSETLKDGTVSETHYYHPMQFIANGSINIAGNDSYYVIGNFGNTVSAKQQMNPYEEQYRKLMDKYWYKDGIGYSNEVADADSIVYKLDVTRPENGWGELYLMFAPKTAIDKWTSETSYWSETIRPEIDHNQVDATALEGGVIYCVGNPNSDEKNDMSINPLLTDAQKYRYSSYTVYLNVTKSTYRIEFYDAYYLGGPAVKSGFDSNNRILLEATTNPISGKRSWNYTGNFTRGEKFLVFSNSESMGFYFREDAKVIGNTPVNNVDDVVAPAKEQDFDFFNHMKYEQGIGRTDADAANAFTFNLPTGEYTIRFYDLAEDVNGTPFYTIDKVVKLTNVTSTYELADGSQETKDYGGWRTYSDDVATYIPQGVKAYYVDKVANNGMVHMKELQKIIPAHCGVILHDDGSNTYNLIPVVESNLFATKLTDVDRSAINYLVDSYQHFEADGVTPTSAKVDVGEKTDDKYNYFFNSTISAKKKGEDTYKTIQVPLNFWRAKGSASRKKTYLQVPEEINAAWYTDGTFSYSDNDFDTTNSSKSYCFVMSFIDIENNEDAPVVTNISTVNTQDDSDAYYNIQGMRVARPITSGLYIKNGKKIYVK